MNILYIGSAGALSLVPFRRLLDTGHVIKAVGVYSPILIDDKIIALENASLALIANQKNISLVDLSQPVASIIEQCQALAIDIILMSCFSKRLPDELIKLPGQGCFNLHPSLLPRYRGPEPVFWQMKEVGALGVSWHRVVHDFDAGDVVAEKRVVSDDGASYSEIQLQLAENGAELMLELLQELQTGTLTARPQNSDVASYYPYPQQKDFLINTRWTARHAYNFMCATQAFGQRFQYRIGGDLYLLKEALDFDINSSLDSVEVQADRLYIPCREGVLIATYTDRIVPN